MYPPYCWWHLQSGKGACCNSQKKWELREATPGFLTKHVFGKGDGCVDSLVTFVKAFRRRRRRVEEVPDAHAKSIRRRGCGSLWTEEFNPKKLAISQCPADEPLFSFRECIWNVHHFGAGSIILNCHLAKPLLRCFFWWYPAKPRYRNLLYPPCTHHTVDDNFNRERERAVTHRKKLRSEGSYPQVLD